MMVSLLFHFGFTLISFWSRESLGHEGKGKAYDKTEKGKAGEPKGKRERPETRNLIRDVTRQPDRTHARHETISRFGGAYLKANSLPQTSDFGIF